MTNEEKAKEVTMSLKLFAILNTANGNKPQSVVALMEKSALEMAEWKDQQFKEYLEKKKSEIEVNMGNPAVGSILFITKDCMLCLINKIINELFKEG